MQNERGGLHGQERCRQAVSATHLSKPDREGTHLVRLGLELLLSHAVGPVVPENAAHGVWQHHLDVGVHVLQEAACSTDGPSGAASSYKVTHTRLGLHPDLHRQVQ